LFDEPPGLLSINLFILYFLILIIVVCLNHLFCIFILADGCLGQRKDGSAPSLPLCGVLVTCTVNIQFEIIFKKCIFLGDFTHRSPCPLSDHAREGPALPEGLRGIVRRAVHQRSAA